MICTIPNMYIHLNSRITTMTQEQVCNKINEGKVISH
jgi:hypothetical protein